MGQPKISPMEFTVGGSIAWECEEVNKYAGANGQLGGFCTKCFHLFPHVSVSTKVQLCVLCGHQMTPGRPKEAMMVQYKVSFFVQDASCSLLL
jgi:hypothetical protein